MNVGRKSLTNKSDFFSLPRLDRQALKRACLEFALFWLFSALFNALQVCGKTGQAAPEPFSPSEGKIFFLFEEKISRAKEKKGRAQVGFEVERERGAQ